MTTEVSIDTDYINLDLPTTDAGGDISCVDFNNGGTAQDGGAACNNNGLTLSEAGAPIIDSSGDFSINWVASTLKSKMSSLP